MQMLPKQSFRNSIDIGCGLGIMMECLEYVSDNVIGLDIVNNTDRKNVMELDLNKGNLPFKDDSFDLVVCTEVLEHLHYPHKVLAEIQRILSDDGYAVIGLPNSDHIYNRRDILFGKEIKAHGFDSYGHQCFTTLQQNEEFVKTQFDIIKKEYIWIDTCKVGKISAIWKNPYLFAQSIIMCIYSPF